MFYNTKIEPLFVIVYVWQHVFNEKPCFIDVSQKKEVFCYIMVAIIWRFVSHNILFLLLFSRNIL